MDAPAPPPLPPDRSEASFRDFKEALSPAQALAEANRCLYCADAPCVQHCPTAINIPEFIRKISTGNLKGSARTILSSNIFGMSCARVCPVEVLCAGACVYNETDAPPIAIGRLQRHATDAALAEGWRFFEAGPDSGRSVALVGGGPASLAAAHELRRRGHACTIYDAGRWLGGLNTTGVAPYKLRADAALAEVAYVLGIGGIEVRSGVVVGRDLSWDDLLARHDAIFIGVGLGADRTLDIPGKELAGVEGAVAFIERFKLGRVALAGVARALVLGGGNTAIDAVRELLGLGVPEVTMVYRGAPEEMSGYAHEWTAAKVEGARALFRAGPLAYLGREGRVVGVRCARLGADRRPTGETFELPADLVLLAIGQARLGELVRGLPGVEVADGRVVVDAQGATGNPRVFAGGDCISGGQEVVNAVAEGKRAAEAIDRALQRGGADHG